MWLMLRLNARRPFWWVKQTAALVFWALLVLACADSASVAYWWPVGAYAVWAALVVAESRFRRADATFRDLVASISRHPAGGHVCSARCLCFALDCGCSYCAPVTRKVDELITDERTTP
jgi:hypothetical protein